MKKKNYILILLLFAGIFLPFLSNATHLRAGEITAKRISSTTLTYRVTLTTYTDEINGKAANDGEEEVSFYFGFSTNQVVAMKVKRKIKQLISPSTVRNVYDTTFTFPAPGRFTISCGIINRNERTLNLPQPSESISFFVQTTIVINASFGLNSTPVLLNIPIDSAGVGRKFIHNPGAFDIDGDSLSYRLTTPQKDKGNATGIGEFIENYRDPNLIGNAPRNEANTGPATFRIDSRTGDLIWDAPQVPGQYNVAFIIEEWRKAPDGSYLKIGEIVRDMQIIVVATDNKRPELVVPPDICVEAGKQVKFDVQGKDVDNQELKLTSTGGVYNLDEAGKFFKFIEPQAATFTTKQSKSPVSGSFVWNTNCLHVRDQPYDVLFKVEDFPGRFSTQLVDIKTIKIKVLPPRPIGLIAKESEQGIELTWQKYSGCNTVSGKIHIYRKDGCSGLNPSECSQGMPSSWGYKLIATVTSGDTTYIDKSVQKGAVYSYRLVAEIQASQFIAIQSTPSTESCIGSDFKPGMSVITNISIDKTDAAAGEVTIKWTRPIDFPTTTFKGPYSYKLYRATGLGGEQYQLIHTQNTLLDTKADTVFTDKGLNTKDLVYRYKLELYINTAELFGTTPPATTVRLSASPDDKMVRLYWEANVPWLNDNRIHNIYREDKSNPGVFNKIAAFSVSTPNTFSYNDTGRDIFTGDGNISIDLQNGQNYCYKVETAGVYDKLPGLGLLMNYSQVICATPADRSPPCPPTLSITGTDCETIKSAEFCNENTFSNTLKWQIPPAVNGVECRKDIVSYKIYYSRYQGQRFGIIDTQDASLGNQYVHKKNRQDGFAGCYYVTAVSSLGIESSAGNVVCVDNCENISFPNVFSPNNDGLNDTFSPMNCPAFVKDISYEIFNTNGAKVAAGSGTEMNWDGKNTSGKDLSAGAYYYLIKVEFERLEETTPAVTFKGWVKLMR